MSTQDPMIGRVLGGTIEIRRIIGVGGMGRVYEAFQEHLGRSVAVKVLSAEHSHNPAAVEYFIREARACSRLRHPHIIQIYDFGKESDGMLFLAMELIPGRPLREVLANLTEPMSQDRVITIIDQTLDALDEAHAHGIIHRDLKPDNLMVETTRAGGDFVKVLDFGIARMIQQGAQGQAGPMTQAGLVMGTPHYMSPEQATAQELDARSDLYAIASVLFEMMTGRTPYPGDNTASVLVALLRDPVPIPSRVTDRPIDPALEAVCLKGLAKAPADRFQSAREFRQALAAIRAGAPLAPGIMAAAGNPTLAAPVRPQGPASAPAEDFAPAQDNIWSGMSRDRAMFFQDAHSGFAPDAPAFGAEPAAKSATSLRPKSSALGSLDGKKSPANSVEEGVLGRSDEFNKLGRLLVQVQTAPTPDAVLSRQARALAGEDELMAMAAEPPRPCVLLMPGPPGSGSSLMLERMGLLARTRDFTVLSARYGDQGLVGWREILRQWLGDLVAQLGWDPAQLQEQFSRAAVEPEYIQNLLTLYMGGGEAPAPDAVTPPKASPYSPRPEIGHEGSFRALCRMICQEGPVLLLLDDVPAWDEVLLAKVRDWARYGWDRTLMLALAGNVAWEGSSTDPVEGLVTMELGALPAAVTKQMFQQGLPPNAPASLVENLARLSQGNGHIVQLLLRQLQSNPPAPDDPWWTTVFECRTYGDMARTWLQRQPRPVVNAVLVLAILAEDATVERVRQLIAPEHQPDEAVRYLIDQRYLVVSRDGVLQFVPPRLGRAISELVPEARKRQIHQWVAGLLARETSGSSVPLTWAVRVRLSRHHLATGDANSAVQIMQGLVEEALFHGETGLARDLIPQILRIYGAAEMSDPLALMLFTLAEILRGQNQAQVANKLLNRIPRNAPLSPHMQFTRRLESVNLWVNTEAPEPMQKALETLGTELRNHPYSWLTARTMQLLATVLERQKNYTRALDLANAAARTASSQPEMLLHQDNIWGPSIYWESLVHECDLRLLARQPDAAETVARTAVNVARSLGEFTGQIASLVALYKVLMAQRKISEALTQLETAMEMARGRGNLAALARLTFLQGQHFMHQTPPNEKGALASFRRARDLALEVDWPEGVARSAKRLAELGGGSGGRR